MKKEKKYYLGIYPLQYIWRGTQSDPIIKAYGYYFNYYDIEDGLYYMYKEYMEEYNADGVDYETWITSNPQEAKNYIKDVIFGGYKFRTIDALIKSY